MGAIHAPSDILVFWNRSEAAGNRTAEARRQAPSAPPELRTDVETWLLPLARRRTAAVCDNIKKAKIKLPTVRVIEGNLSLLQRCASASNMFYDAQTASRLPAVFSSITASLSGARLSK